MTDKNEGIIDLGLDWVTLIGANDKSAEGVLRSAAKELKRHEKAHKTKRFASAGYSGESCGGLSVGTSKDGQYMIVLSGEMAKNAQGHIPEIWILRATRCDYQVTVQMNEGNVARKIYDKLARENETRTRKRHIAYMESETGSTVYVNKRSGAVYIRVYDKSDAYRKAPNSVWRFEVEYKKALAHDAFWSWLNHKDRGRWVRQNIQAELEKRSIHMLNFNEVNVVAGIKAVQEETDHSRTVRWLKSSVLPALLRLDGAGYGVEAYAALGLNKGTLAKARELDNEAIKGYNHK